MTIVNQIDGVYQAELGLAFQVVLQNTYAGADPYSGTTDSSSMLVEFRDYWNANRGNVARDVAHMWTGRDMNGSTIGIGYVGVICASASYSYGVSQRFTSAPQRYILTAHELGHNFGLLFSRSLLGGRFRSFLAFGGGFKLFGGRRGRFALEHLLEDVDALGLEVGLLGRPGDVHLDRDRDFRVQRNLDVVQSDFLDRAIEHDLALG